MKLHLVQKADTSYLNMQGSFNHVSDLTAFANQISDCQTEYLEISFLDARMLPAEVILCLHETIAAKKYKKVKISIFYRYLSTYLSRLGIRNTYQSPSIFSHYLNKKIQAIVIGGSAGSLDKILNIMHQVPMAEVSFFIVQHILEHSPNYLNELLRERTAYQVADVAEGIKILPGHVYIAPPALHMSIERGRIRLTAEDKINFARPSISRLFETAAHEYGSHLLSILLCGYGYDGSTALEHLKTRGATVIIEDPEECDAKEMVINAWKTGFIDYKFPLPEIVCYLKRMLVSDVQEISNSELKLFLSAINEKYGYNYLQYEKESIKRRIRHGMNDLSVQSINRFKEMVLNDEDMFEFLFLEFSINVTDFFRDPEMYKVVRDEILPYLESFPHLKIWSAGCSTGLEPYSLAINLEETGLLRKTQIYASDINPYVVEEAKNGILPAAFLDKAEKNYRTAGGTRNLAEYFQSSGGLVRLREAYLNKILFFQHSLLNQGSFHEFQLILCRNVLIYFDKELQKQVLKLFAQSLDLNGFLVLGKNEAFSAKIPGFELIDRTHCIYKRTV